MNDVSTCLILETICDYLDSNIHRCSHQACALVLHAFGFLG